MNTVALYEQNAYLKTFTAAVTACEQTETGWWITLDQTAFYPEGGGQPCDHGTLGGVSVLDVQKKDDEIRHLCDAPLSVGQNVEGSIDWARRFDHMQQHSGEHLLSGTLCHRFGCDNVGFHMGADVITIDFNKPITPEQLAQAELDVNRVIWSDIETVITFPDAETLAAAPYRSKKELTGQVRLVEFPGVDICACCGTHVARVGEVGLVKVLSCVKFRDGVRVEILCGERAYRHLSLVSDQNRRVGALLSAQPHETAAHVQRLKDEAEALRYQLNGVRMQLLQLRAREFAGQHNVLCFEDGLTGDLLRKLATGILEQADGFVAVFSGSDEAGYSYCVGQRDADISAQVKAMNAALNGRGGGRGGFAQGSVKAERSAIEAYFSQNF